MAAFGLEVGIRLGGAAAPATPPFPATVAGNYSSFVDQLLSMPGTHTLLVPPGTHTVVVAWSGAGSLDLTLNGQQLSSLLPGGLFLQANVAVTALEITSNAAGSARVLLLGM